MNIEARLRQLETDYRAALSATVVAKANYLALAGDPSVQPAAARRARARWQNFHTRKRGIASQMGEIEDIEHELFGD